MHIPDGFLSPEVAAGTAVVAAGAVGVGLRRASARLDDRVVPLLGVTGAFVFAAQMLNFPVAGGTSGHFLGAALATILLGPWLATLVLAVVLATQSFVFADGGDQRARGERPLHGRVRRARHRRPDAARPGECCRGAAACCSRVAGAGAWLAVIAGAGATAGLLALSGTVPLGTVLPAMLAVHVVIGLGEAVDHGRRAQRADGDQARPDRRLGGAEPRARGPRDRPGGVTMRRATDRRAGRRSPSPRCAPLRLGLTRRPGAGRRRPADSPIAAPRRAQDMRPPPATSFPGVHDARLANAAAGFAGTLVVFAARRRPRRRRPPAARARRMSGLHALESAGLAGDPASPVHRLDARAKLLGLAGLTLVAATAGSWPLLAGCALLLAAVALAARMPGAVHRAPGARHPAGRR